MLYMQGGGRIGRVHGPFVTDREVEDVVAFLREQGGEPDYVDEVTEPPDDETRPRASAMERHRRAPATARRGYSTRRWTSSPARARRARASSSATWAIGYNRAAKLIEQMEKEGIITAANHVGKREILVRRTNDDED